MRRRRRRQTQSEQADQQQSTSEATNNLADQQQFGASKADVSNARSLVHQFGPSLPGISATTRVSSKEQSVTATATGY